MFTTTVIAALGDMGKVHVPITAEALVRQLMVHLRSKNPHDPELALAVVAYFLCWSSKVPAMADVPESTRMEAMKRLIRVINPPPGAIETGEVGEKAIEVVPDEIGLLVRGWVHQGHDGEGRLLAPVEHVRIKVLMGNRNGGAEVVREVAELATTLVEDEVRVDCEKRYHEWMERCVAEGEAKPPFVAPVGAGPEELLDAADAYYARRTAHPYPTPPHWETPTPFVRQQEQESEGVREVRRPAGQPGGFWLSGQEAYKQAQAEDLGEAPEPTTWELVKALAGPAVERARYRLGRVREGVKAFRSVDRMLDLTTDQDRPATLRDRAKAAWEVMGGELPTSQERVDWRAVMRRAAFDGEGVYIQGGHEARMDIWADLLARIVPADEATVALVTSLSDNLIEKLRAAEEGWPGGRRPRGKERRITLSNARWMHVRRAFGGRSDGFGDIEGPHPINQGVFNESSLGDEPLPRERF